MANGNAVVLIENTVQGDQDHNYITQHKKEEKNCETNAVQASL